MKILRQTGDALSTMPLTRFFLGFSIAMIFMWGVYGAYSVARSVYYAQSPRQSYYDYSSVEFIRTTEDGNLLFASSRMIKQSYPIQWNDILFCDDGSKFRFTSSQDSSSVSPKTNQEYRTVEWDYNSEFPYGRTCHLESSISMSVEGNLKKQTITSSDFIVKE